MASESVLKELYQIAKTSSSFRGIPEDDVWKACLAYKNRSDENIRIAMDNIQKKEMEIKVKSQEQRKKLAQGKEKIKALQKQESDDRRKDAENAEKILEALFNS